MKALMRKSLWLLACFLFWTLSWGGVRAYSQPAKAGILAPVGEPGRQEVSRLAANQEKEGDAGALYAQCAVLMDGESGRILYGKNETEIRPMASTTKIMTCILALESCGLEEEVEVSSYAASMPDVQLNIHQGERYRLKDLLYSLMLESHNDSAAAIAEHAAGTVEAFAAMMNEKAAELGCRDTWFITPNGLDAVQTAEDETGHTIERAHSTTAADLARIMRYCIMESPQKEAFLEITRASSWQFSDLDGKRSFSCQNHNAFLNMFEGAVSGKTGFTGQAGYCYVGAAERDGKTVIVALLGCGWPPHKTYKWTDMKTLASYGLEQYERRALDESLIDTGRFSHIPVDGARTEEIGERLTVSLTLSEGEGPAYMLMKDSERIQVDYQLPERLEAPLERGKQLGTVTYLLDGEPVRRYALTVPCDIPRINFLWRLRQTVGLFLP